MTVHIGELSTEVVPEPEQGRDEARDGAVWDELERLRALEARLRRDALRTRAREYDD